MTDDPPTVGLDPGWLAEALAGGAAERPEVQVEGSIGTGQMSRNVRCSVSWPHGAGPSSVVVKVPSADPATRTVAFALQLYQTECEFYRSVAPEVDVSVPRVLANHLDVAAGDFALVLEDLQGSEPGDHLAEPDPDHLALALEQAAALHAPAWGDTGRPAFAFLHRDPEVLVASTQMTVDALLPAVFERLGDGLDPEVVTLLERFAPLAGRWRRCHGDPVTVVHGDLRPDNLLYGVDPSAPPIAVVDWQTASLGLGATDVAYLIGGSLEPDRRREVEDDLVATYRDHLRGRGVTYPEERCRTDMALGALHGVLVAITATTTAERTERGDALFTLMLDRHGRHALDLGSLDLVAGAVAGEVDRS
jgi:aminoglycoside phosphotransferase (APT) family kinase protein